jgi:hypothetical protein
MEEHDDKQKVMFVDAAIAEEEEQEQEEQATATQSRLRRNLLLHSKQTNKQAIKRSSKQQECKEPQQQWRSLKRAAEDWPCNSRKRNASSTKAKKKKKRLKKIQRKKFGRTDRTPTEMKVTDPLPTPSPKLFGVNFFVCFFFFFFCWGSKFCGEFDT